MLAYLQGLKFGVRYCVQSPSATFGIIPTYLETRDVPVSSLPRACSAAVTWITRSCFLNLLTFERVMRAVKKCFGNIKTLGNNVIKLRTNMYLIDEPWC